MTEKEAHFLASEISVQMIPIIVEILKKTGYGEIRINIQEGQRRFTVNSTTSFQFPLEVREK